jgi:hypothetical protein
LFAGYLDVWPRLLVLDPSGNPQWSDDALFCGWGRVAALVDWRVAQEHNTLPHFEQRFASVMRLTIANVTGLVTMERPARYAYHVGCPRVWAEPHTEGAGRVHQEVCLA